MLRTSVLVTTLLAASTMISPAQVLRINCQTQGGDIRLTQNDNKTEFKSTMDHNGCRYSYSTSGMTFEKAVIMNKPANGELSQTGLSFFYKPKTGFTGKDSFTVYLCGTGRFGGTGCARLNYNVTVQ